MYRILKCIDLRSRLAGIERTHKSRALRAELGEIEEPSSREPRDLTLAYLIIYQGISHSDVCAHARGTRFFISTCRSVRVPNTREREGQKERKKERRQKSARRGSRRGRNYKTNSESKRKGKSVKRIASTRCGGQGAKEREALSGQSPKRGEKEASAPQHRHGRERPAEREREGKTMTTRRLLGECK